MTRLGIISVTPSPYQRDLFRALAARPEVELEVAYLERAPDDSPWQHADLEAFEGVLPGIVLGRGRLRCHVNRRLPDPAASDAVIVNAPLTALTTQRVMSRLRRPGAPPWVFWGEQLLGRTGWRGAIQGRLAEPLGSADAIVAIGSRAAADYRHRYPGVPVHEIPYACDLEAFRAAASRHPRRNDRRGTCRFLFAGQMIARKGVDVLLEAFARLADEGVDASLVLVGREGELPGFLDAVPAAARRRLEYLGFRQPSELPDLFAEADVFVLPSRHDGWGVVVNQALGAGLPVVTSTGACAGVDLVADGREGLHVPPGDARALTEAMRRIANEPETRARMSEAALARADSLSPARAAAKWVEVLEAIRS